MKKTISYLFLPFKWIWKFISVGVQVITGLLFISCIILTAIALFHSPEPEIPENGILVFAPKGNIVEQRSPIDPFARMVNNLAGAPLKKEILLQDVIDAVYAAADDPRIKALFIVPDRIDKVGLNQTRAIGGAIDYFKQSGKKVIAAADTLGPAQYYLASWADEIYLHPMGAVKVKGFGIFRLYVKDLMKKLAVNFHVFRVGTFKSAVEPLLRNSMSGEAREANKNWLNALWDVYCDDIAKHRQISKLHFRTIVDSYPSLLKAADGDHGRTALDNRLIDGIKDRKELRAMLTSIAGPSPDNRSFNQVSLDNYLQTVTPSYSPGKDTDKRVGIITAVGNIMYGEAPPSQISSDALIRRIRQARDDKRIKALVLRLSTGGGSAFASEVIRRELLAFKQAGKPVVVSMGAVAASGGYWIAADADRILASPLTLTGSIGIFGVMPTFDKSLEKLGIHGDGVGTGTTALFGNPASPMTEAERSYHQVSVEHGYRKFLQVVSEGRNIPLNEVDRLAQGRVWAGTDAQKLGLVDRLGTLEDAVAEAAKLAGIPEENGMYITPPPAGIKDLLFRMENSMISWIHTLLPVPITSTEVVARYTEDFTLLKGLSGDPQDLYAHSLLPHSIAGF